MTLDFVTSALLSLSEDEKLLKDTVRDFAQRQIAPRVVSMEKQKAIDQEIIEGLFELGLMGIEAPEEFGGAESSFFNAVLAVEALAEVDPSVAVLLDVQNTLVMNTLLRVCTPEQEERYLGALCQEAIGSYALSEAASGSDAFALQTKAVQVDGGWKLDGSKLWITNAAESKYFIVFANAAPDRGYKGITAFMVERETEGFTVEKREDKLGIVASSTCPLTFESVRVPRSAQLGDIGEGYKIAMETLNEGRIGIGAQMVGLAQGALDLALNHVHERKQFGKRLIDFQAIQFDLAEMRTLTEASRLMVYHAARLKDVGRPFVAQAAMAKLYSSQVAEKVASMSVELLGGVGFTKEYGAEKFYRDAKIGSIYEGTSNMQKLTIAKSMMRKE